ncbi:MAG: hypothetical protein JNM76_06760 [Betaproteobacteria bacterium]|nr:hypothetical protein [Betaproteobacteria bacterium]
MLPVAVFIFSAIGLTSIANRMLFALGLARVVYWLSICASVATLGAGIALREDPGFANSLTAFLVLHAPLALAGGVGWFSLIARTKGTTVGRKWIRVVEILIARGRQYWLILFAGALIYGTDFIILSQSASVDELASYAALQRLIGLAVVSYGVFLANLWPRLTLKFSTAQHGLEMRAAVDELLRTAWIASGCTLLTGVFLWPVFDDAFRIIFGNAIQMPSTGCLIAALIHCAVRVWTDTLATALFAISDFKWFLKWVPIQIAVTVGAGLLLAAPFGSTGVVLGMLVGSVATACWLLPLRLLKLANAPILQSKPGS